MKTAMQELIDELKLIEAYPMSPLVLRMATDLLEKEKEQIKTAFASGWNWNSDPEKYYQETYVQQEDKTFKQKSKWTSLDNTKQHIIDIMKADEDDGLYDLNK
jgi:hypothetical protein